MAQDPPDPTRTSKIAERMGVSKSSANNYRNNLLHARLIEEAEYGYVAFTIPYMGKYLKDVAR